MLISSMGESLGAHYVAPRGLGTTTLYIIGEFGQIELAALPPLLATP
jgi:hypothetical protein